jgi:cytochrome c biogenesis protein CcmG/thiol:disulfide interchange protein DsbE
MLAMGEISTGHKAKILFLILSIGAGALFLLIGNNVDFKFTKQPAITAGTKAPDFSFPDLEGKTISLSDFRGKIVLLNIWATWCRPCVEEMPSIERLYNQFKDDDFIVLAVSIDTKGKKAVGPFMAVHNLSFKALLDTKGAIQNAYRTIGVPESFIIDKNGIILQKVIGSYDWSSPKIFQYFKERLEKTSTQKG